MKLYYSNTSPYSRKVRLMALEKGLESEIEEILVNPYSTGSAKDKLVSANPLGKIPTLELEDGKTLFDSPVICEYLDGLSEDPILIPVEKRLDILWWQAIADGMTDAAYNITIERRTRPQEEQSVKWIENWTTEILRTLDYIETRINQMSPLNNQISLAHLALASSISYLEFRVPEILFESKSSQKSVSPNTFEWYQNMQERPSMQVTQLREITS